MRKGDNTDIDRYRDTEDTQEGYIHIQIDSYTHTQRVTPYTDRHIK